LSGAAWDQAPGEVDQILGYNVVFEWDAGDLAGCTSPGHANAVNPHFQITVDGQVIYQNTGSMSGTGLGSLITTKTVHITSGADTDTSWGGGGSLVLASATPPAQVTHHPITATIDSDEFCTQGGQLGISSLELDVIRMR
jgi:hypothetical protein